MTVREFLDIVLKLPMEAQIGTYKPEPGSGQVYLPPTVAKKTPEQIEEVCWQTLIRDGREYYVIT